MAILVYARALGAARSGNAPAVREEIERLETLRKAMMKAKIAYWAQQADIQIKVASAWAAFAEGNKPEALKLMREGADMEDASEKHPVTPGHVLPARELLGEMLLELKQPALALKEFEASHKVEPNRFRGLYGAARAAAQSGEMVKAKTYYEKLVELCRQADAERPELKEAKEFLAKR
jgi:tetratricopeptide (TPR) repeat protein